jgi:hypothetical protein
MGMKKDPAPSPDSKTEANRNKPAQRAKPRIHPVVIYPFVQPNDYSDLEELYRLVAQASEDKDKFARPITVVDRKTHFGVEGNKTYLAFRRDVVDKHSDVLDAWCVDTCQMWYCGLGEACEHGTAGDVYWLIPGDFNYGSAPGRDVLGRLHQLPEIVLEVQQDFCVGEIAADHCNSKQLIDTYGTFTLLYNWFPAEAQGIRKVTERPRSEFFAISHGFLCEILRQRWYAYEQTMVMLLRGVFTHKQISKFFVGSISDLPQGRESLASAIQQVERTERVLKSLWLEWNQPKAGWAEQYFQLQTQSDQVRRTALLVLKNLLG